MEIDRAPTSLAELAAEVSRNVEPLVSGGSLSLVVDIPPTLPPLFVDRVRVKQVLFNLLSNAIKFTPGGGRVRLSARSVPGPMAEISVEDTGVGIGHADLPKLFHDFSQAGSARRTTATGTGLGLALTKRLVELHGGTIRVASEEGRGTTFVVCLPVVA
jgi:signal transduction histidine kinase